MGLHKTTLDSLGGLASETIQTGDFTLEVIEGPHAGKTLSLEKEVVRIGREEWCDFSLEDDPWSSLVHCIGVLEERGLRVQDLKSRNGIKLNDAPVYDALLIPGAKLQVGQSVLTLRSRRQSKKLEIAFHDDTGTLVGKSMAMRKLFSFLPRLGQRRVTTLLNGETGTGKTSIAHAIHLHAAKEEAPFIVVNCGALSPSLVESALFGHEKGAFTGAEKRSLGFFEQADGGTLFLDEIAELPLELQPKLLDVLERRKVRRLGSEVERDVDVHVLTATHKDLGEECKAGRFREDLYFRLSVVELTVPPLRERKEDLPLLIEAFLKELHPEGSLFLTGEATQALKEYVWPGNIRELRNVLERASIFLEGNTIKRDDLELGKSIEFGASARKGSNPVDASLFNEKRKWVEEAFPSLPLADHSPPLSLKDLLKHTERFYIAQALEETNQNAPQAAKLLSLSESWFYSRIKLYGLRNKEKTNS